MIDVFIAIVIIYCQEWDKKTRDTGYFARSTSESSSVCDLHKCVLSCWPHEGWLQYYFMSITSEHGSDIRKTGKAYLERREAA